MLGRLLVGVLSLATPTAVAGYDDRLEELDCCDNRYRGEVRAGGSRRTRGYGGPAKCNCPQTLRVTPSPPYCL